MATTANYIPLQVLNPTPIVWTFATPKMNSCRCNPNSFLSEEYEGIEDDLLYFLHTDVSTLHECSTTTPISSSKEFIKHIQNFNKTFKEYNEFFNHIDYESSKAKFEQSIANLIDLNADALSSELTSEETLFFTLKIRQFTFYIEQYLADEDNEDPNHEFILTCFENKNLSYNENGNLSFLKQKIVSTTNGMTNDYFVLAENELSY